MTCNITYFGLESKHGAIKVAQQIAHSMVLMQEKLYSDTLLTLCRG
jgi:hypothetical protein